MASVSSLGLSGLPLTDLLENLRTSESQVLTAIQDRQTAAKAKLTAYGKLKDAVASLQTAAQAVGKTDAFGALTVKSGSDAFSATADNGAIPGQYSVQVNKLASAQTLVYAGQASRTTDIGTGGTLKITIDGTEKSIDLSSTGTSLNKIMAAINADPDIGVNATIVNDGTPGSQYRLLLTSRETGEQNAVTNISVDGNADLDTFLGYAGGGSTAGVTVQDATNAELTINGIAITSQSNTVENVIDGVKLTLNQTTTSAANLTLTRDDSVAKKAVQTFVSAYNSLLGTIKTLTAYDTTAQTSSALTGDSLARSVQTRMRDALSGAIDTTDGTEKSIDLSSTGTSLNKIMAAINADPDIGVNATIVNDGTPGSQYRLLLTSRETGEQNAVTNISVDGNADLDTFLGYAGGGSTAGVTVQDATNAELTINGIAITSQSNTVENVIDGVKLTLNQTTTSAANLTLTRDDSVAKKAVQTFVSAYNSLLGTIKTLTAYDTTAQTSSALTGDSLARSVQTRMRDALSGAIDTTDGTTLSKIGITTDPKTGELKIDDDKLTDALSENLDGVTSLFTGTSGVGTRVDQTAQTFVKFDGSFATTIDGLNKTIADIQKQYDATSDRIDQRMETYRAQFTQLDAMVSQMNSLSSYLTQQLSALNGSKNS